MNKQGRRPKKDINETMELLNSHFAKGLTREQIAPLTGYSVRNLRRLERKHSLLSGSVVSHMDSVTELAAAPDLQCNSDVQDPIRSGDDLSGASKNSADKTTGQNDRQIITAVNNPPDKTQCENELRRRLLKALDGSGMYHELWLSLRFEVREFLAAFLGPVLSDYEFGQLIRDLALSGNGSYVKRYGARTLESALQTVKTSYSAALRSRRGTGA